jgi:hypothetical protein
MDKVLLAIEKMPNWSSVAWARFGTGWTVYRGDDDSSD